MRAMGIDIGTTTISVVLLDEQVGDVIASRTISHNSFIQGKSLRNCIQDSEKIYELTKGIVTELIMEYGKPDSIGFTGQMHGVLYVDENGKAVTPLYTWQDGSGNENFKNGLTYAQFLKKEVGMASAGYGITTHFYLYDKGEIPKNAYKMTTISDYIAIRFCGRSTPVMMRDMAASWGCFDLRQGKFMKEELEKLGIPTEYLPDIYEEPIIIGKTIEKAIEDVPVVSSLGDNQASFIGAVRDFSNTVLINIGTGSQVSFATNNYYESGQEIEIRPCVNAPYILVGSGLCGGRAYAMLEAFYRRIFNMVGVNMDDKILYEMMEKNAQEYMEQNGIEQAWNICTTFAGTRQNPSESGKITDVSVKNFSPEAMTVGMIKGILEELYSMYQKICHITGKSAMNLVGSGNGIRKNVLMQKIAEIIFGMNLKIPKCEEEAAFGAALQSLVTSGMVSSLESVQEKIRYI